MDLFLMILRFLFGLPAEANEVEPIVIHADGRTSNAARWLGTQRSMQQAIGAPTLRQRFPHSKSASAASFWERCFDYLRNESHSKIRCQDDGRTSKN